MKLHSAYIVDRKIASEHVYVNLCVIHHGFPYSHVSFCIFSVNLMTCMGSITAIAKQRPVYMARVIQGFEMLHGKIWRMFFTF